MKRTSRTLLMFTAALSLIPSRGSCQQSRLAGDWIGTLQVQAVSLRIVFHLEQTDDATWKATMDSPDQGAAGIAVDSVSIGDENSAFIGVTRIGGSYAGTIQPGDSVISGEWRQGGGSFPMELRRMAVPVVIIRPQEPKKPLPYKELDVSFVNTFDGDTLAGTLTLPEGDGPFPAAVLITGSGPQDRDETVFGHKPFLVLSDHLTRNGIAVLRYDDRGTAHSTGDFSGATSVEFARDAAAAFRYLKDRPEISTGRVGLIGHSEGGIVAPMVANEDKSVSYLVLLAGPSIPGTEIILMQDSLIGVANGAPPEQIAASVDIKRVIFSAMKANLHSPGLGDSLEKIMRATADRLGVEQDPKESEKQIASTIKSFTSPWFKYFLFYDPAPALSRVTCRVLALNGEKDLQVPAGINLAMMRRAFQEGGNSNADIELMPGLNHLFQTAGSGSPAEYARIEETIAPSALNRITLWIQDAKK